VIVLGPLAFKFARGERGRLCNWHEADLYRRSKSKAHRASMLCPVLYCFSPAIFLIMRRAATPVTKTEIEDRKAHAWNEWDYMGAADDEPPFEWKLDDWGKLDGKLVAVDYGSLPTETVLRQPKR
jgi:hypothetical protein